MIAIYEPLYLPGQSLTEPAFRPLRLESNAYADWREFRILVDMYKRGLHREQRYTGLFSPKFGLKTQVSGKDFIEFVHANADADVCFINPFAHLAYVAFNVWMNGEITHPDIVSRAQALFDVTGIGMRIADVPRHGPNLLCYCNFWVGTEQFWDDYVGGTLVPIAEFLDKHPNHPACLGVLEPTTHSDPAPFLPFIVERLFSSFLSQPSCAFTIRGYPMDPERTSLTEFEREIVTYRRSEIDAADRSNFFPPTLIDNMACVCRLWRNHQSAYYQNRPHPHTGGPLTSFHTE
jgi:hypothetical protein